MADTIHGKNLMLFVKLSGTTHPLGFQKSFDITFNRATTDISSKDSGDDMDHINGMKSYSMNLDAIHSNSSCGFYNIWDLYNSGCTVSWVSGIKTGTSPNFSASTTNVRMSGNTTIETLNLKADMGDVASYTGTFKGKLGVCKY